MESYYQALMLSIVSCLILCTGILSEQVTTSTESNDIPKRIVCYYQSWTWGRTRPYNYDTEDIPTELCTDIIYAFLRLNGETWELENTQASKPNTDMLLQFTSLGALSTPRPNSLLAVGGGADDSSKWSIMVADPVKRSKFVASALLWINKYSFNGLDLDWEYPGVENKENFVKLVEELVHAFEPYKLLLTSAVSMVERKLKPGYDIQRLSESAREWRVAIGPGDLTKSGNAPMLSKKTSGLDMMMNRASASRWTSLRIVATAVQWCGPSIWTISTGFAVPRTPYSTPFIGDSQVAYRQQ